MSELLARCARGKTLVQEYVEEQLAKCDRGDLLMDVDEGNGFVD